MITPTPHIGDTGEFPTVGWGISGEHGTDRPKRGWSPARVGTGLTTVAALALYILSVTGHRGQRVIELPTPGTDLLRVLVVLCAAAHLVAWAWDRVSPRLFARFAATRIGDRQINDRLCGQDKALAEIAVTIHGIDARLSRLHERVTEAEAATVRLVAMLEANAARMDRLASTVGKVPAMIRVLAVDRRQDGYEQALRDVVDEPAVPTQRTGSNGHPSTVPRLRPV